VSLNLHQEAKEVPRSRAKTQNKKPQRLAVAGFSAPESSSLAVVPSERICCRQTRTDTLDCIWHCPRYRKRR